MADVSQRSVIKFGRLVACLFACVGLACTENDLEVKKDFELGRFTGKWYEVARIPRDYDELCHDTVAEYRRTAHGAIELQHTCRINSANGVKSESRATATVDDPEVPAKLSLQIGLYTGAYWVLDTGVNYEYAVIGHPSRLMLWVLAREPQLDDASWHKILNATRRQGFNTDLLKKTPQSGASH